MARKRNYPVTVWLNEKELILLKDKGNFNLQKTPDLRLDLSKLQFLLNYCGRKLHDSLTQVNY